ncbi:MAG TPA: hypothetical protein VGL91_08555 [Acidobacteriota bacterium]
MILLFTRFGLYQLAFFCSVFPVFPVVFTRVTHSGLKQEHIARKDYISGWLGVLQLLKDVFQSLDPDQEQFL